MRRLLGSSSRCISVVIKFKAFSGVNPKWTTLATISCVYPFLDTDMLIRVGGRLQEASTDSLQKHQIIFSPKCHITRLIVEEEHLRLTHGGPEMLHASL
jgi:hypothetical protein